MGTVWVVSLILALVFTRLSLVEAMCQPGEYLEENCGCCKPCLENQYTAIANTKPKCIQCRECNNRSIKTNCTTKSDTVCACPAGQYDDQGDCFPCSRRPSPNYRNEDYEELCRNCQSPECMKNPKCKKRCETSRPPVSQTNQSPKPAVRTTSTTSPSPHSERMTPPRPPSSSPTSTKLPVQSNSIVIGLCVLGTFVMSLALLWFLILFCKILLRQEDVLPCWKTKKLEGLPQETKEQRSHLCSSPTTLAFTISEESPMMALCQEPSAHNSGHVQPGVHKDTRRCEHSDRWPAILLYEIIKEVPLRRWKEFLRLLSVPDQQMERVELETGLGSLEKQYQMLRLWSQRPSASLRDVYSSLHHMDLLGCAQQLQENLERLQWRSEARQGITV